VLTITDRSDAYAKELVAKMKAEGIRVVLDDANEKIGAKIRNATMQKIPYMLIIGDKEVEEKKVSVRLRTGEETKGVVFEEFLKNVREKIKNKEISI
jgi:threonyl-tRNA synthetase